MALLLTHLKDIFQEKVDTFPDILNSAMGDELYPDTSLRKEYTFHASHFEPAYNRYCEKVHIKVIV